MLARLLEAIERKGERADSTPQRAAKFQPPLQINPSLSPAPAAAARVTRFTPGCFLGGCDVTTAALSSSPAGLDNPTLYRTFTAGGGLEVRQCFDCGEFFLFLSFFPVPVI